MDEIDTLKHTLAAGKGDAPRQRGSGWRRLWDHWDAIEWRSGDAGANSSNQEAKTGGETRHIPEK